MHSNPSSVKRLSVLRNVHSGPGTHSASYVPGPSSPGVKRQGRKFDHLPPSCEEAKNETSCTSAPLIYLHGVDRTTLLVPFMGI